MAKALDAPKNRSPNPSYGAVEHSARPHYLFQSTVKQSVIRQGYPVKRLTVATLFTLILASPISWATANDSYQAGISSFKSAHYEQAIEHFVAARKARLNIPTLHYNLGATHYKLGQYRLAEAAFSAIHTDTTWGALAQKV